MEFPPAVRDLLWDLDARNPRLDERLEPVVIERVMARGGWEDMRWLLSTLGRERLRVFLERRGCRVLPPRELRFWSWVCGVPEPLASDWVRQARDRERAWRG